MSLGCVLKSLCLCIQITDAFCRRSSNGKINVFNKKSGSFYIDSVIDGEFKIIKHKGYFLNNFICCSFTIVFVMN